MVGKVTIDPNKCHCLGRCVQSCPQDVLEWDFKKKKAFVINEVECITCYNCMEVCPFKAINVTEADWKPVKEK
jgi:NAD-dependent dihydropyrimidine dehydrogenase PreA subunit